MVTNETLQLGLKLCLESTHFHGVGRRVEGKVRDNYVTQDGRRILVTTDRISAFDRVLGTLPFKGQLLSSMATWWFRKTEAIVPNHLIEAPDPNVMIAHECEPLPVEMVVRSYLTGVTSTSVWTAYARGERTFCGHALPDGMKKNEQLPKPIVTPSTKAEKGGHDVSISAAELIEKNVVTAADFETIEQAALKLFAAGQAHCRAQGLILADTKYEFGRRADGTIVVMDEIHTPDSSRFWIDGSYEGRLRRGEEPESFDKEYVRRWLADRNFTGDGAIPAIPDEIRIEAARRYIEACDMVRGVAFEPDLRPPTERVARAIGATVI